MFHLMMSNAAADSMGLLRTAPLKSVAQIYTVRDCTRLPRIRARIWHNYQVLLQPPTPHLPAHSFTHYPPFTLEVSQIADYGYTGRFSTIIHKSCSMLCFIPRAIAAGMIQIIIKDSR